MCPEGPWPCCRDARCLLCINPPLVVVAARVFRGGGGPPGGPAGRHGPAPRRVRLLRRHGASGALLLRGRVRRRPLGGRTPGRLTDGRALGVPPLRHLGRLRHLGPLRHLARRHGRRHRRLLPRVPALRVEENTPPLAGHIVSTL